ncbi:lanthionine synthetase LanC family protein [Streptomyces sp. NPDC090442]|uniref:lanthionine synthetase LanC family protein n=1 Tax=Streptomyces sp. NPDC090442 TaxID=3365962 RepID=UPI0037F29A70
MHNHPIAGSATASQDASAGRPTPPTRPIGSTRPARPFGPEAGWRTHALQDAVWLLDRWSERTAAGQAPPSGSDHPSDPGVPVLAHLLAGTTEVPAATAVAARATVLWARGAGRGMSHPGLYDGGLAGTLVGLRQAATLHPALHPVADRLAGRLLERASTEAARANHGAVTFRDYDLILGPAGTLLAMSAAAPGRPDHPDGAGPHHPQALARLGRCLAALCATAELDGLRTHYPGHPQLGWLHGRINTGMGHGAAGVLTALTAAVRQAGRADPSGAEGPEDASRGAPEDLPELVAALRRVSRWLRRQAFVDARGVRSWDGAGLDAVPPGGARRRQAWCYGTPGVAWALWDAADACGDQDDREFAAAAFDSLVAGYDEEFHLFGDHLGDRLGLCHGAAGVLAVADALHRHAQLPSATALRARLLVHLDRRRLQTRALGEERTALLGGACGTLSVVLTATATGTNGRGWLPCLGLR